MSKYIYEVKMQVPRRVYEEYLSWLKQHVTEMLELPVFTKAEIQLELSDHQDYESLRCFYEYEEAEDLKVYLEKYAPQMRGQLKEEIKNQINFQSSNYKRLG